MTEEKTVDLAIENTKAKVNANLKEKQLASAKQKAVEDYKQPELPVGSKHDLKEIAKGIHKGEIFTSQHISPNEASNILGMVFMPLMLMGEADRQQMIVQKATVFFAYNKDAGPRSINGYPIFMSVNWLNDAEWVKILQYIKKLEKFEKELEV